MADSKISDVIGTYLEMTKEFRTILRKVTDPGQIYSVTATSGDELLDVLWVSLYDEEIDGAKLPFDVTSRDLASDTAFHLSAVRFLLVPLRVLVRGVPRYIIEPGKSTRRWVRTRLGVASARAYREAVLGGPLGQWLVQMEGRNRTLAEEERDQAIEREKSLQQKVIDLTARRKKIVRARDKQKERADQAERERVELELQASLKEGNYARIADSWREALSKASEYETSMRAYRLECAQLKTQLRENGIEPRPYTPVL